MGHQTVCSGVHHGKVGVQPFGQVIGVEDRDFGGAAKPGGTQQRNIGPGDGQDAGGAPGGSRYLANGGAPPRGRVHTLNHYMVRQIRCEMGKHTDRSHAGSTSPVRYGESLVQVDMRNIRTNLGRPADAHQRIEIGPVHIHLPAMVMHGLADIPDLLLKDAMRGRVGNH